MYSISIPTPPTLEPYTQIGFVTTWENTLLLVYWASDINQVLLLNGSKGWFMQPNGRIIDSLAELLNVPARDIQLGRVFFMKHTEIEVPKDADVWEIYDHTWARYAEKKVSLQCTLQLRNASFLATHAPLRPSPLRIASLKVGPPGARVPLVSPLGPPGLTKPVSPVTPTTPQLPSLSRPLEDPFPHAPIEHLEILSPAKLNFADYELARPWV